MTETTNSLAGNVSAEEDGLDTLNDDALVDLFDVSVPPSPSDGSGGKA
jgi:hypothetical protein